MTLTQQLMIVGIVALGTMATRFLPFVLFPAGKALPSALRYLGGVLPAATLGLLVIYCLKDVSFLSGNYGLPELIAIAVVAGLHLWRKNVLLSIGVGTVVYMVLVQVVFV